MVRGARGRPVSQQVTGPFVAEATTRPGSVRNDPVVAYPSVCVCALVLIRAEYRHPVCPRTMGVRGP